MQVFELPRNAKPIATPRGGPAGTEVDLTLLALPPATVVLVGFGSLSAGAHELLGEAVTDGEGAASVRVRVPEWAEAGQNGFFFWAYADQRPRGLSDPWFVTTADGTVRIRGRVTDEGERCLALRDARDDLYTLTGETGALAPGAEVAITGTLGDPAACGQGVTVAVRQVRPL